MNAYPHDPPLEIFPDLLFVHGRMRMGPGVMINRNMVVLRHAEQLVLANPIRLDAAGEAALASYGEVRHVIRLGSFHGVDDAYTVERFGAQFWCQADSDQYPLPKPDFSLEEGIQLPIPNAELFVFRETKFPECALLLKRHGGVLISCDAVQHWESTSNCSLLGKLATHALGFMRPANIGPPWRRMMTPPGGSLKPDFERLLELPFDHLIGAHGQVLRGGAKQALRASFDRVFG